MFCLVGGRNAAASLIMVMTMASSNRRIQSTGDRKESGLPPDCGLCTRMWSCIPPLLALLALSLNASAFAATVEYIHTDGLGTPIAVTDASANVIERSEYEPYGRLINRPLTDGVGFTGHVQDVATGLTYMQQRYYDPILGLFLSTDPVTAYGSPVGQFHRYRYANNNPYRFKDPDGRKCATADGMDSCTFDDFKDRAGNAISRDQALSSGSKLAKFLGTDRGSRILRAEAQMTAKYTAAKSLAARGGQVTIKGNSQLAIPDQNVSGSAIVSRMEAMRTIANESSKPGDRDSVASVRGTTTGAPSDGPINFWRDGAAAPSSIGQTFGHEILHTIYSGADLQNRGWANPLYNPQHQTPFNEASDAIQ